MFAYRLDSLVLRGVSVLRDGQIVGLRLGTSYGADVVASETPISSMRLPSPGCTPGLFNPGGWAEPVEKPGDSVPSGAGRSLSFESRRSSARSGRHSIPLPGTACTTNTRQAATCLWPQGAIPHQRAERVVHASPRGN
jgi:hypothetical protein